MLHDHPIPDSEARVQCPLPLPEPPTGLILKNLSSSLTQSKVFDLLARFGPIYSCNIVSKPSSPEVTATVQFFLQNDAQEALQDLVSLRGDNVYFNHILKFTLQKHCSQDIEGNLM
jgi:hypothetical protein